MPPDLDLDFGLGTGLTFTKYSTFLDTYIHDMSININYKNSGSHASETVWWQEAARFEKHRISKCTV